MARGYIFHLRLDDAERAELEQLAKAQGRSKADVIRQAMGWEPERKSRRLGHMTRGIAAQGRSEKRPDPRTEPGKAAIERFSKRINQRGTTE